MGCTKSSVVQDSVPPSYINNGRRTNPGAKYRKRGGIDPWNRKWSSDPLYFETPIFASQSFQVGAIDEVDDDDGCSPGEIVKPVEVDFDDESIDQTDFPFENIVFEGGGSQGSAYIGAIRELERLGLLRKLKRFGGTSIGAGTATLLALGYGSETFLDMVNYGPNGPEFLDAPCGIFSLIPNFLRHFGWHPNRVFYKFIGDKVKEKLGSSSATFKDLYDQTGRELCVVVTNLSIMMEEYCHVKTTPDLPIRTAVRMSISIPGLFCAVRRKHMAATDIYVDGGLICNYPIHCYDGWFLSMKKEDAFLRRIQSLQDVNKLLSKKERFGTRNEKTIGMITVSDYDRHVLPLQPEVIPPLSQVPVTELSRKRHKDKYKRHVNIIQHNRVSEAMSRFLRVLNSCNTDENDTISRKEMKTALKNQKDEFTDDDMRTLFGDDIDMDMIFDQLDASRDGKIEFRELMSLASHRGIGLQTQHIGSGRQDLDSPTQFVGGVFQALLLNIKRAFCEGDDIDRTVVLNVDYIKSTDFKTEQADRDFMLEQGRLGLRAFLAYWIKKNRKQQTNE